MGHKPRSPEEILAELKETVSEAKGMINDLNASIRTAREEIQDLAMEKIIGEMKKLLDSHRDTVREITGAWDKLVEDKFGALKIEMHSLIRRYAEAMPGEALGIDEEGIEVRELALATVFATVGQLGTNDTNKEFENVRRQRRAGEKVPPIREEPDRGGD